MMDNDGFSRIEIKSLEKDGSAFTEVYIDGRKIKGVRSYKLEQKVGNSIPTLTLDLNALNVAVDQTVLLYAV